jgi:hypothetical protein
LGINYRIGYRLSVSQTANCQESLATSGAAKAVVASTGMTAKRVENCIMKILELLVTASREMKQSIKYESQKIMKLMALSIHRRYGAEFSSYRNFLAYIDGRKQISCLE